MNNKQFFIALHSGVAIIVWGSVLYWTRNLWAVIGALISIGFVILLTNAIAKSEISKEVTK